MIMMQKVAPYPAAAAREEHFRSSNYERSAEN